MNIFESSMNKNKLRLKKKKCLRKGIIESTAKHKNFLGDHENVFLYDFGVPGIVHFPLFEVPLGTVP